jgi:Pumilio-family RNA binding repeat
MNNSSSGRGLPAPFDMSLSGYSGSVSANGSSSPMTSGGERDTGFDTVGYGKLLRKLIPIDNQQGSEAFRASTAPPPPPLSSLSAFSSDDSVSASSEVEKIKKRLAETEKRLAQSEVELQQHRLAKLTMEHTLDNVDSDTKATYLPPVSQPLSTSGNLPRLSPSASSFGLSDNIWTSGNSQVGSGNSGHVSPGMDLMNWHSARSVFHGPSQDLNQPLTNHGYAYQEPPTPNSATYAQANFQSAKSAIRRPNPGERANSVRSMNIVGGSGLGLNSDIGSSVGMMGNTPPETPVVVNFMGQTYPNVAFPRIPTAVAPKLGLPPRTSVNIPAPTRLSPTAAEFTVEATNWRAPSNSAAQALGIPSAYNAPQPTSYLVSPRESSHCENWSHHVEKIVRANDQQSSILMQQKIKSVDRVEKVRMCDSIVNSCEELMTNRFGNFLVQRVLEHGTPEQILQVASTIRGRVVPLSMDAFGCHVIQKAFDTVPEDFKIVMVRELLSAIPETVKHRYACHVWQKLFELRWTIEPPEIMSFVNTALAGQWWDVAMGETGSLVVQNIFENCNEQDKRPCIEEVLEKIDIIAKGQYGNWCIQHICEHGAPHDRSRAIDHILGNSAEYSMDQFASKVIEKCLKTCGDEFLDTYLARVCTSEGDRPRVPLVDIACNQYGNYLVQWILQYAESDEHKQLVRHHARLVLHCKNLALHANKSVLQ